MSPFNVNPALTPDPRYPFRVTPPVRRPRRVVENDDYAAFTRRILTAHAKRIATGDIEGLHGLAALAADIDTALHTAVSELRAAGYSWADIAAGLGVTRQAAQQRFTTIPGTTPGSGSGR
jgi:hypothetical protein